MGVEYRALLIPRDNTLRPNHPAVIRLMTSMRQLHFVTGGLILRTTPLASGNKPVEDDVVAGRETGELIAFWPVEDHIREGLTHPIAPPYKEDGEGGYYDLELHFSDDFVSDANESVDPIDENCICGNPLGYSSEMDADLFYASRIRRVCPRCNQPFLPQNRSTTFRDGITGEERSIRGGLTYRFAIVIDCGKSWPRNSDAMPAIAPAFRQACEAAIGAPMYEVGYFY